MRYRSSSPLSVDRRRPAPKTKELCRRLWGQARGRSQSSQEVRGPLYFNHNSKPKSVDKLLEAKLTYGPKVERPARQERILKYTQGFPLNLVKQNTLFANQYSKRRKLIRDIFKDKEEIDLLALPRAQRKHVPTVDVLLQNESEAEQLLSIAQKNRQKLQQLEQEYSGKGRIVVDELGKFKVIGRQDHCSREQLEVICWADEDKFAIEPLKGGSAPLPIRLDQGGQRQEEKIKGGTISPQNLQRIQQQYLCSRDSRNYPLVQKICQQAGIFKMFSTQFLRNVLRNSQLTKYGKRARLVDWDQPLESIFIILRGTVSKHYQLNPAYNREIKVIESFYDGTVIGQPSCESGDDIETALFGQERTPRANFCLVAEEQTLAFRVDCKKYKAILNEYLVKHHNSQVNMLRQIDVFRNFSKESLLPILSSGTKIKYSRNEVVLREGETGQYFYLILSGVVRIVRFYDVVRRTESCRKEQSTQLAVSFSRIEASKDKRKLLQNIDAVQREVSSVRQISSSEKLVTFEVMLGTKREGEGFCFRPFLQSIGSIYPEFCEGPGAHIRQASASVVCESRECTIMRIQPETIMHLGRDKLYNFVNESKQICEFDEAASPKEVGFFLRWEALKASVLRRSLRGKYKS